MKYYKYENKYAISFSHYPWVVWVDKNKDVNPEKLDDRVETDFDYALEIPEEEVPALTLGILKSAAKQYRRMNRRVGEVPPCYIRTETDGGWEVALAIREGCEMSVEEAIEFARGNELFLDSSHPIYRCDNFEEWGERFPQYSQFAYKEIILVGYNSTGFPGQKWSFRKAPEIPGALARSFVEKTIQEGTEVPFPDSWM